ncbi:MAG: hypothetical protein RIE31_02300 [Alphaproteobacteria bacterium]
MSDGALALLLGGLVLALLVLRRLVGFGTGCLFRLVVVGFVLAAVWFLWRQVSGF